jgi:hypothetical protein
LLRILSVFCYIFILQVLVTYFIFFHCMSFVVTLVDFWNIFRALFVNPILNTCLLWSIRGMQWSLFETIKWIRRHLLRSGFILFEAGLRKTSLCWSKVSLMIFRQVCIVWTLKGQRTRSHVISGSFWCFLIAYLGEVIVSDYLRKFTFHHWITLRFHLMNSFV